MASLEERVASLEAENANLRSVIEALTKRLDAIDAGSGSGGTLKKSARPKTAAVKKSDGSTSDLSAAGDKQRPATATPGKKKTRSSSVNLAKPLQVRKKEDEKEKDAAEIPENRKGHYNIGNRNIYYVLPAEHAKDEKGEFPSAELKDELALDYVYGYNGRNAFGNLYHAKEDGKIVYSVAGTGVVSDVASRTQRFFTGHNEDILCLAVHPTQPVVATGQLDPKGRGTPYICIWSEAGELVRKIVYHDRGVCAVAFTPDGKYLASIGNDDSHTLALWAWEEEHKPDKKTGKCEPLVEQMTSKSVVFSIAFSPVEEKGRYEFVTTGEKLLKVWSASNLDAKDKKGRTLASRIPSTFAKTKVVVKQFQGIAFVKDHVYVGTDGGQIYKIKDADLAKFWQGHQGAVTALTATGEGFASSGEDGKVKLWDEDGKEVASIDLSEHTGGKPEPANSLDFKNGKLLVGLANNVILQIDTASNQVVELVNGHSDEVWGLAVHPSQPFAVTTAHDKTVRVWNYATKQAVKEKTLSLKGQVRAATFTEDGKFLAVSVLNNKKAGSTAHIALIDFDAWNVVWNNKYATENIDALAFSPDGSTLAGGSWDQLTHIVNVADGKEKATCKGHTSSVLMVNFSDDGKFLMTNSRDYEILFWNAENGKRVNKTDVMDTKWSAWNCFLGWAVQGIWEGAGDGTDINSVDRSKDQHLLAAGDDFGQVRLYPYPAVAKNCPHKEYPGHSSHVTQVRFTPNNDFLFSTGGADFGVFQWKRL